ncbi:plexin domain-containing protein 2 [Phthorimaea operculella]|nr:plexin domain-containing protein 2 [Phthorimaea operculella]
MDLASKKKSICTVFVLTLCFSLGVNGYNRYAVDDVRTSFHDPHIFAVTGARVRRDAPPAPHLPQESPAPADPGQPKTTPANATDDSNRTNNATKPDAMPTTATTGVTQIPLLGRDGHGILRVNATNMPRVSEPISIADDKADPLLGRDGHGILRVNATNMPRVSEPISIADDSKLSSTYSGCRGRPRCSVATRQTPLLGRDGHGILRVNATNMPRVSEPISIADDNVTAEVLTNETPEKMKAEQNITNLKYDDHSFYNSSFIGNQSYFEEYWTNITNTSLNVHPVLSNSHRRATTLRLTFDFPFYGHPLRNITVATGGFIYTGEHVHNWLAATQYIAPLMANFDTTLTNDSYVKMYDDGEKFTAFWENVTLQEDRTKKFTFAVTLYKNGDIIFAYKSIPIPVQNINDSDHPVKVGISDAYLNDRILFLIRRKTIYEYHRVSFKSYEITNGTILVLKALPTCLQYDTCESCVNHDTGFDCKWCDSIRKCSSGTDRNKQDWQTRGCDRQQMTNSSSCPAGAGGAGNTTVHDDANNTNSNTAYTTDTQANGQADVHTIPSSEPPVRAPASPPQHAPSQQHSAVACVVAVAGAAAWALYAFKNPHTRSGQLLIKSQQHSAVACVVAVAGAAAWALYAFKNPHTRSGQLLIKYRPSQWSWRRGEARYTAATIHM